MIIERLKFFNSTSFSLKSRSNSKYFYYSLGIYRVRDLILYLGVISFIFITLSIQIMKLIKYPFNLLLFSLYPLILLVGYKTYLVSVRSSFSNMLNHEKPLTYLLMSILGKRFSLERVIYLLVFSPSTRFLDATKKLFRMWITRFYLSGRPIDEIIYNTLDNIPDSDFRKYFKELIRINWIGGDITTYLRSTLKDYYNSLRDNWINAWKDITGYLEIIIIIFGLFPSMLASLVFLIGFNMTINLFILSLILYPLISYFTYSVIERKNPNLPEKITVTKYDKKMILISIGIFVVGLCINLFFNVVDLKYIILISIVSILPITITNLKRIIGEHKVETDILVFLRELEELMKGGLSLLESIKQVDLSKYSTELQEEIREMIMRYENGADVRGIESRVPVKSLAILKLAIGEIIYSGGGLDEVIELRDLLENYYKVSILRKTSSVIPILTSMIVMFLGGYSTWVIRSMLSGLKSGVPGYLSVYGFSVDVLSEYSRLFLLSGAVYTGLLIDKAAYGRLSSMISLSLLLMTVLVIMILNFI